MENFDLTTLRFKDTGINAWKANGFWMYPIYPTDPW